MSIMMEKYLRAAGISTPMGRVLDRAVLEAKANNSVLQDLGKMLKGKTVKDGGKIASFSIENLLGPTLVITVEFKVQGHQFEKEWYISKRDDEDDIHIEYGHNKTRVGKTAQEAEHAILGMLACPVKVTAKLGTYKGWDLYMTTTEGGMGGKAAKGNKWVGTDVSYTRPPDRDHITKQLQLTIDH